VKRFANEDRHAGAQLRIGRLYHPESTALDALVDVLQILLLDDSESRDSATSSGVGTTCFPLEPERPMGV
jgi:hypothetical protein